jgi:hypothetical protein
MAIFDKFDKKDWHVEINLTKIWIKIQKKVKKWLKL